ncbi:hypothetical protein [Flavisolibacter nicotianae]|uniref:hypothetical protein n=1 Tax=Flavisolibacter nicotianae TaxID=2364882 RepID=UPI000EB0F980|nr:hypothetical protein [Flavisolibacter nicotianae]
MNRPATSPSAIENFITRWKASGASKRTAEEARGLVRWLRPDYQNPRGVQQAGISIEANEVKAETGSPEGVE